MSSAVRRGGGRFLQNTAPIHRRPEDHPATTLRGCYRRLSFLRPVHPGAIFAPVQKKDRTSRGQSFLVSVTHCSWAIAPTRDETIASIISWEEKLIEQPYVKRLNRKRLN